MYTPRPGRLVLPALAVALLLTQPALASFPGMNGRISLARYDGNGFEQIWTANPDLTAAEQLTATPEANSVVSAWAPDASRIAFDSDRSGVGPDGLPMIDIFTMKPNGSDLVQLTHDAGFNGEPSYSPGGTRIAFESDRGAFPDREGIYAMHTDGADVRPVVLAAQIGAFFLQGPKYAPDGRTIAFTAMRRPQFGKRNDPAGATGAVYLIDADGRNLRRLTPWGKKTSVDVEWSPDGRMLVFETEWKSGAGPDLHIVRSDGTGLRNLTDNPSLTPKALEASFDPAWAPDGSRILFQQAGIVDDAFGFDLWTIRPDGTDMHPVEETAVWEDQPSWGSAPLR